MYQGETKGSLASRPARWHVSELPHHLPAKAVNPAFARERDQRHVARLPGLEPHRRASRNVEPHAARLPAVERQRRVGLEEMIVRADLDRPVAGVSNRQHHGLAAGVERDLAVLDEHLAGYHQSLLQLQPAAMAARASAAAASNDFSRSALRSRQPATTRSTHST